MKDQAPEPYTLDDVLAASKLRWLNIYELEYLLNPETTPLPITDNPPAISPPSGTILLFDRGVTRTYKSDGYDWVKKKNSQKVREDHVKLRIEGKVRVAGIYVHCTNQPTLHRRAYYLLDPNTGSSRSPLTYPKKGEGSETDETPAETVTSSLILLHYLDTKNVVSKAAKKKSEGPKAGRGRRKSCESESSGAGRKKAVKSGVGAAKAKTKASPNMRHVSQPALIPSARSVVKADPENELTLQRPVPDKESTLQRPISDKELTLHRLVTSCDQSVLNGIMGESFGTISPEDLCELYSGKKDDALDTLMNLMVDQDISMCFPETLGDFEISANVCIKPEDFGDERLFETSGNAMYGTMGAGICHSAPVTEGTSESLAHDLTPLSHTSSTYDSSSTESLGDMLDHTVYIQ